MESINKFFKVENDPFFRQGEAAGKSKGARNVAIAIAIRMKEADMPIAQIAKYTKLSIGEIEKL